jgi:hypothetical protein
MRLEDVHAIKHAREMLMALSAMGDFSELFDPDQQAKLLKIEALLDELGHPSIDEELDAAIAALLEIQT